MIMINYGQTEKLFTKTAAAKSEFYAARTYREQDLAAAKYAAYIDIIEIFDLKSKYNKFCADMRSNN